MDICSYLDENVLFYIVQNFVDPKSLSSLSQCNKFLYDFLALPSGVASHMIREKIPDSRLPLSCLESPIEMLHILHESNTMRRGSSRISCGKAHTAVINEGGSLFTYGFNSMGQLGTGNRLAYASPIPIEVPLAQSVSCGSNHTCVLTQGGRVFGFGSNSQSELFAEPAAAVLAPREITLLGPSAVVGMATGNGFSAFLLDDKMGSVVIKGSGLRCSTEVDDYGNRVLSRPSCMLPTEKIVTISAGDDHMIVLTNIGRPLAVGSGEFGKLGVAMPFATRVNEEPANEVVELTAVEFPWDVESIAQVSTGSFHSAFVTKAGDLYTWGQCLSGQLGHGQFEKSCPTPKKVNMPKGDFVLAVACGKSHTVLSTLDRRLIAFGSASFGQVGFSGFWATNKPQYVQQGCLANNSKGIIQLAAGETHSGVTTTDGKVFMFGEIELCGEPELANYSKKRAQSLDPSVVLLPRERALTG